jgi:hypothetical protein
VAQRLSPADAATLRNLQDRVAALELLLKGEPYQALTYNTGWSDYGGGEAPGSFARETLTVVSVRGLTRRPAAGSSLIATLPTLCRPTYSHEFSVGSGLGSSPFYGAARITILPNGEILLREGDPSAFLILNGIRFDIR